MQPLPEHIFRAYDIRGIVDRDLTEAGFERIGEAFGTLVVRAGGRTVVTGRDCRLSSASLQGGLMRGLARSGLSVRDLGMVPTPVVYYAATEAGVDAAVMVTGSHNPPDFNGMKMTLHGGPVYGEQIQEIRQRIATGDVITGEGEITPDPEAAQRYMDWVFEHARFGEYPVKVVVDAGNGAGGPTAVELLTRLGLEVVPMYCEPDGHFPNHHPDPTVEENLNLLRDKVLAVGADFGIGFDGDADRIGVIDADGAVIWGDKLMIVFSRDLLRDQPGATIVGEVKCSQTLFDDITARGGVAVMWKVGHSLIKAKMKELGAALAGEMSGHIFFKHRFFGFDDAIYAATRLAEIISRDGAPLATHLEGVPHTFVTPEIRMEVPSDALKFKVAAAVAEGFRGGAEGVREVVAIDGVRVIFEDGWGLVRASNTQPVLVLRAEATSAVRRDAIEAQLRGRVEAAIEALG